MADTKVEVAEMVAGIKVEVVEIVAAVVVGVEEVETMEVDEVVEEAAEDAEVHQPWFSGAYLRASWRSINLNQTLTAS